MRGNAHNLKQPYQVQCLQIRYLNPLVMLWLYPHSFFEHDRNKHNLQAIEVQSVPPITPTSPHLFCPSPDAEKPGCGGSRCRKRPIWSQPTPSEGRVTRPNSTGEEQNSRRHGDDCVIFWKFFSVFSPFWGDKNTVTPP